MPITLPPGAFSLTFAQAEYWYQTGRLTADQWLAYRAIWQYSAPRFSEIGAGAGPAFPRVRDYWRASGGVA